MSHDQDQSKIIFTKSAAILGFVAYVIVAFIIIWALV